MKAKHKQIGLSDDGESILLRKFHGDFKTPHYADQAWLSNNVKLLKRAAGIDIETTGLDFATCKIIELAIRPFTYRIDTGEIVTVEEGYSGLQDPLEALSEEVQEITGLTDQMLKGEAIHWGRVAEIFDSVEMVIAHNAKFDRPFVDRAVEKSRSKLWACSLSQVDWDDKGFGVKGLGVLSMWHGFFADAHRAMNDVNSMLYLLSLNDQETQRPYLFELAKNSTRESVMIYADKSPFESKDMLKARHYRWDAGRRSWYTRVYSDQLKNEVEWLEAIVYCGNFLGKTENIPALENFKIWR